MTAAADQGEMGPSSARTLADLSAAEAARKIVEGAITSEELVGACLERIAEVDETVQAWTHLDTDYALEQARRADAARGAGEPCGPLHGVPVGIKDIFDTDDMPTEDGSPLHAGRAPVDDASAVARLRDAGAIIMGKTVTTEFAVFSPGKTRNPHDPSRTPGGSSSGSAAAVASRMVPLAIGSQTHGSTIRPASYCGILGFKPSHGLISRHRMLALSRALDHVGMFARTVEDIALIAEQLMGYDENDPDTRPGGRLELRAVATAEPPMPPKFAFVKTPAWDKAEDDTKEAFAELVEHLGPQASEVKLTEPFEQARALLEIILRTDLARHLGREYERGRDQMSESLREMIEDGQKHLAVDYLRAIEMAELLGEALDGLFDDYDAILTPAAPGEAPQGLEATGNPMFSTIWTLCGVPAITVPIMQGANGMPLGAQLVGRRRDDARLLRTARWLANDLADGDAP